MTDPDPEHAMIHGMRWLFTLSLLLAGAATAADLAGTRTVRLHGNHGETIVLGQLVFTPDGDGYRFEFKPDRAAFEERFLAMRPFPCLDGETVSLCQFPFASPRRITARDLTDLEYQFMFLQKPRASVSLDPYNGVYYEMALKDGRIEGRLKEVDMSPITAPDGQQARPIRREDLVMVDTDGKWLPRLTIE
ncbi:MAG: hypothetical protein NVS9B10_26130 [Nevskia sp.]